ncbi:MAG: hypothetical protein ACI9ND_002703 [Yoonia sp.]|jgi:hypothetical protein
MYVLVAPPFTINSSQSGFRFWLTDLLPLDRRSATPTLGEPLPTDKTRVHFFTGNSDTKDLAYR